MRRLGRINYMLLAIIIGAVGILILVFFNRDSPEAAANRFLIALAKGDVKTVVDMSYFPGDQKSLKDQWEFAMTKASPYYRFEWVVKDEKDADPDHAAVQLQFVRNSLSPSSYPDNKELPMVRVNGTWKVDVTGMDSELYPASPRVNSFIK